ncbi:MAG TPA: hypothetical protein VMB03_16760 [Bryobacteraceae bacterium]|nr:hypothetical protein [Bryobacteraceae bacterium]
MADDLKSVAARVTKVEADLKKAMEEIKGIVASLQKRAPEGAQIGNMGIQISRLQGDAVKLEGRVKALESKK